MAICVERTTIGYHMFVYQDDVRRHKHKILQLKSKINLTRLLLRKSARSCNRINNEEHILAFDREVKFALQLERQLAIANFNELKPQKNYFAEQMEAKLKILQQNKAEASARKVESANAHGDTSEADSAAKHNQAFLAEKSPHRWWLQPSNKSRLQRSELKIQEFKNANNRWSYKVVPRQSTQNQRLIDATSLQRLQLKVQLENWQQNGDGGKRRLGIWAQPQSAAKRSRLAN